jgi:hypothetical protein
MKITLEPQIDPETGRPCRLSKTGRISRDRWINGAYRFRTRHTFKYIDKEQPRFFQIELDWNNKLIK